MRFKKGEVKRKSFIISSVVYRVSKDSEDLGWSGGGGSAGVFFSFEVECFYISSY